MVRCNDLETTAVFRERLGETGVDFSSCLDGLSGWSGPDYRTKARRNCLTHSFFNVEIFSITWLQQVDGGCGVANIKEIAEAGADMFVAGSAIFNNPRTEENYKETISKMRSELADAKIA